MAAKAKISGRRPGNVLYGRVIKSPGSGVPSAWALPAEVAERLTRNREKCMRYSIRLLALAMFSMALIAAPVLSTAYANPDENPSPPASSKKGKKKGTELIPSQESQEYAKFASAYRAAYSTVYDRQDYAAAIDQLKALGHDDNAAVANLIGYSYRKLGDYKLAQVWYERALKIDPNHVKTWQYYGLWQVEQGNREQAQYHLSKIAQLAGTNSEQYRSLAAALEQPPGTGLAY
jgi:tetratricopeptide (TPR) repeat protein